MTTSPDEKQLRELLAKFTPHQEHPKTDALLCGECGRLTELQEDLDDAAVNALPWLLDELAALRKQVEAAGDLAQQLNPNTKCEHDEEPDYCDCCKYDWEKRVVEVRKVLAALRAAQPTKETKR